MHDQILTLGQRVKVPAEGPIEGFPKVGILSLQSGDGEKDHVADANGVVEPCERGEGDAPAGAEVAVGR